VGRTAQANLQRPPRKSGALNEASYQACDKPVSRFEPDGATLAREHPAQSGGDRLDLAVDHHVSANPINVAPDIDLVADRRGFAQRDRLGDDRSQ
jgi:hypothetical protein